MRSAEPKTNAQGGRGRLEDYAIKLHVRISINKAEVFFWSSIFAFYGWKNLVKMYRKYSYHVSHNNYLDLKTAFKKKRPTRLSRKNDMRSSQWLLIITWVTLTRDGLPKFFNPLSHALHLLLWFASTDGAVRIFPCYSLLSLPRNRLTPSSRKNEPLWERAHGAVPKGIGAHISIFSKQKKSSLVLSWDKSQLPGLQYPLPYASSGWLA